MSEKTPLSHYLCFCKEREDEFLIKESKKPITQNSCLTPVGNNKASNQLSSVKVEQIRIGSGIVNNKANGNNEGSGQRMINLNVSQQSESLFVKMSDQSGGSRKSLPTLDETDFVYCTLGELYQLDEAYQFVRMQEYATFGLKHITGTQFQLEIFDDEDARIYVQLIENDSSYFIDFEGDLFKWVEIDDTTVRVLGFKIYENSQASLEELKFILANGPALQESGSQSNRVSNKEEGHSSLSGSAIRANLLTRYEEELTGEIKSIQGKISCNSVRY